MKPKFTPGPWELIVRSETDGIWGYVGPVENRQDDIARIDCCNPVREANARIMAASPEGFELLQAGLECGIFDDAPVFKADVIAWLRKASARG